MNTLVIGGEISSWVVSWSNEISKLGHNVTCLVQNNNNFDELPTSTEKLEIIPTSIDTLFGTELPQSLYDRHFDLVIGSHCPVLRLVKTASETYNCPSVMMILDIPVTLINQDPSRKVLWDKYYEVLKGIDIAVFLTDVHRREFIKNTNKEIPLDHVIYYPINTPIEFYKSGIGIKGDYVISLSRLTPVKSCITIPQALSLLDLNLKYVCVGRDEGELEQIKSLCEEARIPFEHYTNITEEQKFELIKNSLMIISTQNDEYMGGGLPVWEGMFVGKPTIAVNFEISKEQYKEYPFYFDGNLYNLAEKISFIFNLKHELISEHLEEAAELASNVSCHTFAKKLLELVHKYKVMEN